MRRSSLALLALIVTIFAVRNLPWHLDDFDQAKQAFTSYEMVHQGNWWFQHTPANRIATKPPLAGWISAALHYAMGQQFWELAWRIPPFVCALVILGMLWRSGRELGGEETAIVACAAFGLNLTAPRLATLVRTDMMLTLFIFMAGWIVFEKVRRDQPWTTRDRWLLCAAVLGSMLTKGPIAYAFLLPGLAAFALLMRRRQQENAAWSGWWPWLLPLVIFGAWAAVGIVQSREFYEQVVVREFLGRFTVGEQAVHNNQPPWFYVFHLLHKWAPWSLGLAALCAMRRPRALLRHEPDLVWLLCWAIGGFLVMSLIPSKRPDRIFPVIPPLCLLLAAWFARAAVPHWRKARTVTLWASVLIAGGYAGMRIAQSFRENDRVLVQFGEEAQKIAARAPDRLMVVRGRDEGLIMYTGCETFSSVRDAITAWSEAQVDWIALPDRVFKENEASFPGAQRISTVPKLPGKNDAHILIARPLAISR